MLNSRSLIGFCQLGRRVFATRELSTIKRKEFSLNSEFFENYVPNVKDIDEIEAESGIRKCEGSIQLLRHYYKSYSKESNNEQRNEYRLKLIKELKKFPNKTHPTVLGYGSDAKQVELYSFGDLHNNPIPNGKSCDELGVMSNTIRMSKLGNFTGSHSYYLMHNVAELEQALIRYTTDTLFKEGFELISVPDILPAELIEGCGMQMDEHRNQVSMNYTNYSHLY